jgi:geranylgeranyl diphosphate synthase type I
MLPEAIRHVAGYHIGWWDTDGHPTTCKGKAVRPALTLACARAVSAVSSPLSATNIDAGAVVRTFAEASVAAAVAVELVHDFSLLHDDVMDGDRTRRHQPTAWTVFGAGEAILTGDALLTRAVHHLLTAMGASAVKVLAEAMQELCVGQSADLAFEDRSEVSLTECLQMAEAKTGALLGAACQLGALAAGADEDTATWYRMFGRQLGLAFQLVDDLLGIWGDPSVTGKPVSSDLISRKKSLPVVAALASGTSAGERLAWLYGRHEQPDEEVAANAAPLIEQAGGKAWACAEAQRRVAAAFAALHRAGPAPAALSDLETLATLMTGRDH